MEKFQGIYLDKVYLKNKEEYYLEYRAYINIDIFSPDIALYKKRYIPNDDLNRYSWKLLKIYNPNNSIDILSMHNFFKDLNLTNEMIRYNPGFIRNEG